MNTSIAPRGLAPALVAWLMAAAGPIAASAEDAEPSPEVTVHVVKLTRSTVRAHVTAYGTVEPEPAAAGRPAAEATLAAPAGGLLTEVAAIEGAKVARGDRLFQFDSRQADAAVAKARAALGFAEQALARQRKLAETDSTSQKNVLEAGQQMALAQQDLTSAEAARALLEVVSPIDGVIAHVFARSGEAVEPGRPLAALIAPDRLVASVAVPGRDVAQLKTGAPAGVRGDDRGPEVQGTLAFIAPEADPRTGTTTVRVALPAGSGLRPGQFVAASIVSEERANRLVAPAGSVVRTADGGHAVSVVTGDRAKSVPVRTGLTWNGLTEIEGEGLDEGTVVVGAETYGLPADVRIKVVAP